MKPQFVKQIMHGNSYHTPLGRVYPVQKPSKIAFNVIERHSQNHYQAELVASHDFASIDDFNAVCNCFYPKLVKLTNGTFKLYLYPKGFGGMEEHGASPSSVPTSDEKLEANSTNREMATLELADWKLSSRIVKQLPQGTFSSISVSTVSHVFELDPNASAKDSRAIVLKVTTSDNFCNFFRALFAGIGFIEDSAYTESLDKPELQQQLIECVIGSPTKYNAIQHAYHNCSKIFLYIAKDMSAVDMTVQDNEMTRTTFRIAKAVKDTGPIVIALVTKIIIDLSRSN